MKIGIITMHKVLNFGSALQAYALQHKVSELGYDCELIDYIFPRPIKNKITISFLLNELFIFVRNALIGFPTFRRKRRFAKFYTSYYCLSAKLYDQDNIAVQPPLYDLYMSGSDQVWSPRFIEDDTNFMLTFAPDGSRLVSYASSFATDSIPEQFRQTYKDALSRYESITVREEFGCSIVKDLVNRDSKAVCDPTLLLTKEEWNNVADASESKEKEPYILVYMLYYMYNPYPEVDSIVDAIQKELGYRVIYLNGRMQDFRKPNSKLNKDSGPCEYLNLIRNAKFVITTSFHGVAFSSIFGVPFMGIVQDKNIKGDRIHSLLEVTGNTHSLIAYNEKPLFKKEDINSYRCSEEGLDKYRQHSIRVLKELLKTVSDV